MAVDWPEARALALAAILPTGTDRWVALFDGDPIGSGLELTLAGYARVAHQNWTTTPALGTSTRANTTPIVFPTITDSGSADYWAIYDADAPGGVLLRSGQILDDLGQPVVINFTGLGEEPTFLAGALEITATEV